MRLFNFVEKKRSSARGSASRCNRVSQSPEILLQLILGHIIRTHQVAGKRHRGLRLAHTCRATKLMLSVRF